MNRLHPSHPSHQSHQSYQSHQSLDLLLQDDRESKLEGCESTGVSYKVYPTDANERMNYDEYTFQSFSNNGKAPPKSSWGLMVGEESRPDALCCYLVVLANIVIVWASVVYFVSGSWDLLQEGVTIKWEGLLYGGPESYERGINGLNKLTLSFSLSMAHMFIALMSTAMSHWRSCVGLRIMWAEGTMLDFSRQMGYFVGYAFLAFGSAIGAVSVPQASRVLEKHPDMDIVQGDVTTIWEAHYNSRLDADLSVQLMLVGACVCAATVLFQFACGEGFNVCYIIPFARCRYEWEKLAVECKEDRERQDNADQQSMKYDSRERVPQGLPFDTLCVTKDGRNGCPWFATFSHNIFGAFRMHLYVATVFITVAAILRFYSVVPPDQGMEDWPIYIPWSNATHSPQPVYVRYMLHNIHNLTYNTTITEWNDASYYMWTSGILFFTASILTVVGTFGYTVGLANTRASMPANHVIEAHNPLMKLCWP